jgi:molecular chaperone DnaK (HSP70)
MAATAANENSRLIIAIDYGTTFTGMAWMIIPFGKHVVHPTEVLYLKEWQPMYSEAKVPSVISYSPTPAHFSNWGASVDPKALKMSWTKLQLDEQSRSQELDWILDALQNMKGSLESLSQNKRMPPYPANNPVDVVSDYLKHIREVVVKYLRVRYQAVFDNLPKEIVVTIPAVSRSVSDVQVLGSRSIAMVGRSQESDV